MSTGIETWNTNLMEVSEVYPFVGTEMTLAIVGIASWIIWHIIQIRMENKALAEEEAMFQDKTKLAAARKLSSAETLSEVARAHANGM
jgi:hypothetical protein